MSNAIVYFGKEKFQKLVLSNNLRLPGKNILWLRDKFVRSRNYNPNYLNTIYHCNTRQLHCGVLQLQCQSMNSSISEADNNNKCSTTMENRLTSGNTGCGAVQIKVPKGTKDWDGIDMILRDYIFSTITRVFKRHGAVCIDTPVFELREILAGKYGEESKLIYDLADQGGELCSLRYDLTVPFARYIAMNTSIQSVKRYHIAKVYRRDQPAMTKGRMREFYQCDFDIAGTYDPMLADAEALRVIKEVFDDLRWNNHYHIKLNHRKILDAIFQICGVPENKIRGISSAVDKLDKLSWSDVKNEMTVEKGLDGNIADKIGEYVQLKGSRDLLNKLENDTLLNQNPSAVQGISELKLLFTYLDVFQVTPLVMLDMSLARGLDYYTGVIYEVIGNFSRSSPTDNKRKGNLTDEALTNVGSIAAGGRYDNLVGMFSSGKGRNGDIPCVGVSFGVERIFCIAKALLEQASLIQQIKKSTSQVYVMAFGDKSFTGLLTERLELLRDLWNASIRAEFAYKVKPKLPAQFKQAGDIPLAIILGESELALGKVTIKRLGLPEGHPEKEGELVDRNRIVEEVNIRLKQGEDGGNVGLNVSNIDAVDHLLRESVVIHDSLAAA